jgi:hypothetical protein
MMLLRLASDSLHCIGSVGDCFAVADDSGEEAPQGVFSGPVVLNRHTLPGYDSFKMPMALYLARSKPQDNCRWCLAPVGIILVTLGLDRYA